MSEGRDFRLLVLSDPHCAASAEEAARAGAQLHCRLGVELLRRAIEDAKGRGGFDAIALMGDLMADGTHPNSDATLKAAAEEIRTAAGDVPLLVVPGNHDGGPQRLLQAFGQDIGPRQIGPCRFFVFADSYAAGDVCTRGEHQRRHFLDWATQSGGPIIVLQHNPMYPPIVSGYPYMLTDRPEVMADYARAGVLLSVSGHYHPGQPLSIVEGVGYLTAPALAEMPFGYVLVTLTGRGVQAEFRRLNLAGPLALTDGHAHTEFAYCGRGISAAAIIERSRLFGLAGVCLTEHAPQLYCAADDFWKGEHIRRPALWRNSDRKRAVEFRRAMEPLRDSYTRIGLEVELDADGEITLHAQDRWVDRIVGAVHFFDCDHEGLTAAQFTAKFMQTTERLLACGINVLAHPWRMFRWAKRPVPTELYPTLADALAASGVAAEVNFHSNQPDPAFFAECIRRGVKITFGSDSHRLHQPGGFGPHLELLKTAAGTGNSEVLQQYLL